MASPPIEAVQLMPFDGNDACLRTFFAGIIGICQCSRPGAWSGWQILSEPHNIDPKRHQHAALHEIERAAPGEDRADQEKDAPQQAAQADDLRQRDPGQKQFAQQGRIPLR